MRKGQYAYDVHENYPVFKTRTLCPSASKIFPPPQPKTSNFRWNLPPLPLPLPINYRTTTAPCMLTNEIKTKAKPSHVTFKLTTRSIVRHCSHKQCNGIIKAWLHCLTQEATRRYLVNNWLNMMSGHGANPIFFNKKMKIGRPMHPLSPPTHPPTHPHTHTHTHTPLKVDVI